ncbi:MBL fold metallo-hydrolase [Roseovarius sp.]|jgi:glyoxylase-like metal-dependent hydrolase (beta-lactamase superfamily II)
MTPQTEFNPPVGQPEDLGRGIRRILAPNPSAMTFRGTNTYLLGKTDLAVIDPGPDDAAHLEAILRAVGPDQRISHIFVTHAHLDHAPLARALAHRTGAPVLAYGTARAGRSAAMQQLAAAGLGDHGEGVDLAFQPDHRLQDGETVHAQGWSLTAHWTPGHLGNHMCFAARGAIFTGDLVMGWASSLVSPPDGDLSDFMASCAKLRALPADVYHSGHGAPIKAPLARLDWLIAHRRSREAAILENLARGPADAETLARQIYTDTPPALLPAATRNVLAHLIDLHGKSMALPLDDLSPQARFRLL